MCGFLAILSHIFLLLYSRVDAVDKTLTLQVFCYFVLVAVGGTDNCVANILFLYHATVVRIREPIKTGKRKRHFGSQ